MNNAQTELPTAEPVADVAIAAPPVHKRPHPGERRVQILQTLAGIFEHPRGEKITTADFAVWLDVSEATLYRHLASKARMSEGLIEFIEQTVFGLISQTTLREGHGLRQAHVIAHMLLSFADKNPGIARVLVGDALVGEDERLPKHMMQCLGRIETPLKQNLRIAVTQGTWPADTDIISRANLPVCAVLGRWHRYARSDFWKSPIEGANAQLRVSLARVGFPPSKSPAMRGFPVVCRVD